MFRNIGVAAVSLCFLFIGEPGARGENFAELLPETTAVYSEISKPAEVIATVVDHPVVKTLQSTDDYRNAIATPQYLMFRFVLGAVEQKLGQSWREALVSLVDEGMAVGFDPATKGAVLILRGSEPERVQRTVETLVQLVEEDAERKSQPDPISEDAYREIKVYKLPKGAFAVHGGTIVLTNNGELGKFVLDRLLDGGDSTLANREPFVAARSTIDEEVAAWLYLDMEAARTNAGEKSPLVTGQTDNPVAELLFGGVIDNLRETPYVAASLDLDSDRLELRLCSPHDEEWVTEGRGYFFGPSAATGPSTLQVEETVLSLTAFRDVSQMWLRAGELFNQRTADELAKADSGLSTLFGGKDFGEEVLGALKPELQIVVARQEFPSDQPRPAIILPSFAIAGWLKEPEMRSDLRRTFLSLIGFLNVVGATEGRPQLDFEIYDEGEDQLIVTHYIPDANRDEEDAAPIFFNFSPSIAFVDDRMVIASTEQIARQLLMRLKGPEQETTPSATQQKPNSLVELTVPVLQDLLRDNREQLIAQNMLSKGHEQAEAEKEIDRLLMLIGLVRDARLTLDQQPESLELTIDLRWED